MQVLPVIGLERREYFWRSKIYKPFQSNLATWSAFLELAFIIPIYFKSATALENSALDCPMISD